MAPLCYEKVLGPELMNTCTIGYRDFATGILRVTMQVASKSCIYDTSRGVHKPAPLRVQHHADW